MTDKLYIGFDPGNTTGYSIVNKNADVVEFGQVKFQDLTDFLKKEARMFEAVVIEEYRVFQKRARQHAGSDLKTSQVIGKIKFWAELNDYPVVMQPASILPQAERWTQVKMPTDHSISHQVSGYLHVAYYLMRNRIAPSAIEKRAMRQSQKEQDRVT